MKKKLCVIFFIFIPLYLYSSDLYLKAIIRPNKTLNYYKYYSGVFVDSNIFCFYPIGIYQKIYFINLTTNQIDCVDINYSSSLSNIIYIGNTTTHYCFVYANKIKRLIFIKKTDLSVEYKDYDDSIKYNKYSKQNKDIKIGERVCEYSNTWSDHDEECLGYTLVRLNNMIIPNIYFPYNFYLEKQLPFLSQENEEYLMINACILQSDIFNDQKEFLLKTFNQNWKENCHQFDNVFLIYSKNRYDTVDVFFREEKIRNSDMWKVKQTILPRMNISENSTFGRTFQNVLETTFYELPSEKSQIVYENDDIFEDTNFLILDSITKESNTWFKILTPNADFLWIKNK